MEAMDWLDYVRTEKKKPFNEVKLHCRFPTDVIFKEGFDRAVMADMMCVDPTDETLPQFSSDPKQSSSRLSPIRFCSAVSQHTNPNSNIITESSRPISPNSSTRLAWLSRSTSSVLINWLGISVTTPMRLRSANTKKKS